MQPQASCFSLLGQGLPGGISCTPSLSGTSYFLRRTERLNRALHRSSSASCPSTSFYPLGVFIPSDLCTCSSRRLESFTLSSRPAPTYVSPPVPTQTPSRPKAAPLPLSPFLLRASARRHAVQASCLRRLPSRIRNASRAGSACEGSLVPQLRARPGRRVRRRRRSLPDAVSAPRG